MHRVPVLIAVPALAFALAQAAPLAAKAAPQAAEPQSAAATVAAQQGPAGSGGAATGSASASIPSSVSASLKICLRMQDDSPFVGTASLQVVAPHGAEIAAPKSDSDGESVYSNLAPGAYSVEASAPGFAPVKETVEIEPGKRQRTIFLILKPNAAAAASGSPDSKATTAPDTPPAPAIGWAPPGIDAQEPDVTDGVACALPAVLRGAGERQKQFVANLEKFSATEQIEHFTIDATGKRLKPETRHFDYVAQISTIAGGLFSIDEYRDGGFDRTRFPGNVATEGIPAMELIFHPKLASDFNFDCEGLGSWKGRPTWIVHFVQRSDRTSRLGGYRTTDHFYPFDFKGRAWIDAGSYQVLRLEMELAEPIPAVGLTKELFIINYGLVNFHSRKQQLWLPETAELYMERHGKRFYRIHRYSDFKLYTIDTDQSIRAPKESYCFTNTTDQDIAGVLTVSPASGISLKAVSIQFIIPPGKSVYKSVGPGKDISMPVDDVGSATFAHNGPAGAIKADAYLVKESTLDVIADTPIVMNP